MAATSLFVVARFSQPTAQLSPPPSERKEASSALWTRRQCLLVLAATATALKAAEMPVARAKDIPLFGLKPGLQAAEKEAELLVKEGFEAAEKGVEAAEKGVEFAEKEIESAASFGNLNQAGAVAAAELAGILIATSVVKGILGTEA
ncbi:hypothetical protein M569_08921 [Genlisea aurea]|uniref:Uncharacterized protein n=1 Tax=Genlisea aurea TaxID=192259 RepID=S8E0U5_9LAMI|nr:hypothetical protein M569_08921 [Genlisea aurea]